MPRPPHTPEAKFTRALRETCRKSAKLGYYPSDFDGMLDRVGGVSVARKLVASGEIQSGLKRLKKLKRLDLSMEHLMLDERFRGLFKDPELEAAEWRLKHV